MDQRSLMMPATQSRTIDSPLIVAHRGASAYAPENTIPAFALAWEQGADAIEGDFQVTLDGTVVCIHDSNTKRISGVSRTVAGSCLEDLLELDVGSWKGTGWRATRIPVLREVLGLVPPSKRIYLEVKTGAAILPILVREISESGIDSDQVMVIAFDREVIRVLKRDHPDIAACWLLELKGGVFSPPLPSAGNLVRSLEELGADGVSVKADGRFDAAYVSCVKEFGFQFHVWTVDDVETAEKYRDFGVDSITTNRPDVIGRAIR